MRNKLFIYLMGLIGVFQAEKIQAQQENHYTQFMYNKLLLNPGFSGARRVTSVTALYRNQWAGFDGHPKSYLLSADGSLFGERLGGGITLASQETGIIKNQFANGALSYAIIHTDQATIRVGLNGAIRNYTFDVNNPNAYVRERQDQALQVGDKNTQTYGNLGAGLYLDYNEFYAGFSVPNLYKNDIGLNPNRSVVDIAKEQNHLYLMAGGFIKVAKDIHLKPSVLAKYVKNAPFSADLNLNVVFKRRFSGGASYRFGETGGDSVDLLAFVQATDNIGIGFAYDFTLSKIKNYTSGTFEALVRYDIFKNVKTRDKKGGSNIKNTLSNPRFFF
jgi:type IX secretion system PorP/SprF family membrane protein